MAASPVQPYPWCRVPRLSVLVRSGQNQKAHNALDSLLDEFDQEHDVRLGPRKLRCATVMGYCLRSARLGGAQSELIVDEHLQAIEVLWSQRSWRAIRRFMHIYLDKTLQHIAPNSQTPTACLIRRIQKELLENPSNAQPLQEYARIANMHPDYLSRAFKQTIGQTFRAVLRQGRLDLASRLLLSSDLKVTAVARRVGMNDASQFTTDFKKETGMTPHQFRLLCRRA